MTTIAERLDDMGKPAWIALMIVSFIVFWPLGLGILAYLIWSGRMGCGRWQHKVDRMRARAEEWERRGFKGWDGSSSGNTAFDEYRRDTMRRLEEEQKEFKDFLERLRQAKDKQEFDQFMADRRTRRPNEGPVPEASA
jgi:hypothetical protein